MSKATCTMPIELGGTDITRLNALRHGVLSRYTVLPWEDAAEYRALVDALASEHAPRGPTEEHLVEELAGILWRKRRLRLAEAAAHRRGLTDTLKSHRETAKVALMHCNGNKMPEDATDVVRATVADTEDEIRDLQDDEQMTRSALDQLNSRHNDAYEGALAALREDTRDWWAETLARQADELDEARSLPLPTPKASAASSKPRCCPGLRRAGRTWPIAR